MTKPLTFHSLCCLRQHLLPGCITDPHSWTTMEVLGLINLPWWFISLSLFVFTVCLYSWHKQSYFKRIGIKTKPTTLVFGDIIQMMRQGFSYINSDVIKKEGNVFGSYIGNKPSLIINDPEILKHILVKDFSNFTDRVGFKVEKQWQCALSVATGQHWKFIRSTMSPTFSTGKMRNITPLIQHCAADLTSYLEEQMKEHPEGIDIMPLMRRYTLDVILGTGFGITANSVKNPDTEFIGHVKKLVEFNPASSIAFLISAIFPDLKFLMRPISFVPKSSTNYFRQALRSAFEERRKDNSPHKDLLQLLLNAHKENADDDEDPEDRKDMSFETFKRRGFTDDEVFINSLVFMAAGFETTALTLTWILYELVNNLEWQEKLIDEIDSSIGNNVPKYDDVFKLQCLDMILNETLRLHPLAPSINREAKETIEIRGVLIEKGMGVTYCPRALHYSTEYWEEPEKFNPERFSPEKKDQIPEFAFVPFGVGPRNCIGMRLALLEVKMSIVLLLQKFRFKAGKDLKVPMKMDLGDKPATPVMIVATKRDDAYS